MGRHTDSYRGTKLMTSHRYRVFGLQVLRSVAVLVVLAIVGISIAACQTSEPDSSVTSAVNQANAAAQEAAAAAKAAADAAEKATMAAQDTTAVTVAEEAKLVAKDAATASLAAASAAQEATTAAKLAAEAAMVDPAKTGDPGSLVIYSGRSESLVAPIIEQFAEVTGVDVKVKYGSTFAMAATLLEEGSNSPADVFFAQDPGGLGAVSSMLSALPADVVLKVPEWARASDGSWVGISGRARVLVYSTELVSEDELPTSVMDLTDPKWKGKLGWPPGNASFRTMVTAMRQMWGEEETRQWLLDMQKNEPGVFPKNTPIVAAAGAGRSRHRPGQSLLPAQVHPGVG